MSAFQVRPKEDPLEREKREIAARRARCDARAERVLHPKTRMYGVDTLALSQQMQEKQERERLDVERDLYYDDLNSTFARALNEQDAIKRHYDQEQQAELKEFRRAQEKEKRRKDLSEASSAEELTNVPTDFLRFGGEDPNAKLRHRAQKLQQQDWLAQQIEDLQARETRDNMEQQDYERMQEKISEVQGEHQAQAQAERQRKRREVLEFNKQMASHRRSEKAREAQMTQNADDQEVANALNSQLLNEGDMGGASNFKGFSTSQRQRILDEQKMQLDELRAKRMQEQTEEQQYAAQQEDVRRAMVKADREKAAFAKQQRVNLAEERQAQAKEKTLRYDYLDNVVYTNPVQSSFFDQFGRSCR